MKIEHVALYVSNLEKAKDFFITYLNGKSNDGYHNSKTDFRSYFISFDDGARLELMTRPELVEQNKSPYRTGYTHVAFSVGSKEATHAFMQAQSGQSLRASASLRYTAALRFVSCLFPQAGLRCKGPLFAKAA